MPLAGSKNDGMSTGRGGKMQPFRSGATVPEQQYHITDLLLLLIALIRIPQPSDENGIIQLPSLWWRRVVAKLLFARAHPALAHIL